MSRNDPSSRVQKNLKTLVSQCESVAEFCRLVGINRQQFNKYLAGTHVPSRRTLLKVASHFGITAEDFVLTPQAFDAQRRREPVPAPPDEKDASRLERFIALAQLSATDLKPFLGTYFRYHHSSIYPGRIVRAVTVIYQAGPMVEYVTVERFPMDTGEGRGSYTFVYTGLCYFVGNRLFMLDYERRQENEMTSAILMPQNRTPMRYLFGLLMGVASTTFRQPFATRVAFERRSDEARVSKRSLRQATVLDPSDPCIPPSVARYFAGDGEKLLFGGE